MGATKTGLFTKQQNNVANGLPTQFANIQPGNVVIDLGSGAGNDAFIARAETGETPRSHSPQQVTISNWRSPWQLGCSALTADKPLPA